MKQITCEMCGGNDLIKQDGVFVCQNCGMKYSIEDAKKMMIEGSVDVSGSTVKVDNSAFVERYLQNARRAKEKTDWEEVEKYYNMVEQNDPKNIEAVFYSAYGKAMLSLTESDKFKREQKFNVFGKSISVIDDYYDVSKSDELEVTIKNMSSDLISMTLTNFVYNVTTQNNITTNDSGSTYLMFAKVEKLFIESIENIVNKDKKAYLYHILIKHYSRCILNRNINPTESTMYQQKMRDAQASLQILEPSYVPEPIPNAVSGGCYVATAVYGSYDCPEVWALRRYRDFTLAEKWFGRAFIRTYYAISPTIVKWFGDKEWFKKIWKGKLDKMVKELKEKGIEDTPYQDINW